MSGIKYGKKCKKHLIKYKKGKYSVKGEARAFPGSAKKNRAHVAPQTPQRHTLRQHGLLSPGNSPDQHEIKESVQPMNDSIDMNLVKEEDANIGDTIVVDINHFCNRNCAMFRWIQAGLQREAEEARAGEGVDTNMDDSASDVAWKNWEETGDFPEMTPPEEDGKSEYSDNTWK